MERIEHLPYRPVDLLDDVAVHPLLARASEPLRYTQRNVRHGVRQVEKERPVGVPVDEVHCPLRVPGGQLILLAESIDDLSPSMSGSGG
jgi:hypothetical protein